MVRRGGDLPTIAPAVVATVGTGVDGSPGIEGSAS